MEDHESIGATDEEEVQEESAKVDRSYGTMSLRRQQKHDYKQTKTYKETAASKAYKERGSSGTPSVNISSAVNDGAEMIMLTFNDNSVNGVEEFQLDPEEFEITQATAEWMFHTEHLGWKEGLDHNDNPLDEYAALTDGMEIALVTDQMGYKKGLI